MFRFEDLGVMHSFMILLRTAVLVSRSGKVAYPGKWKTALSPLTSPPAFILPIILILSCVPLCCQVRLIILVQLPYRACRDRDPAKDLNLILRLLRDPRDPNH